MDPFTEKMLLDCLKSIAISLKEIKAELGGLNVAVREAMETQYEYVEEDDDEDEEDDEEDDESDDEEDDDEDEDEEDSKDNKKVIVLDEEDAGSNF